jgi:hypothetical protein
MTAYRGTSQLKEVSNPEFYYKQGIFKVKQGERITNQHQDGAIMRALYEQDNICEYAGFIQHLQAFSRPIVDVGAGTRLAHAGIPHTALQPEIDFNDVMRTQNRQTLSTAIRMSGRDDIRILTDTFQEFCANHRVAPETLFNFTDCIYYINDRDIYAAFANLDYGIVGCGTMHVFDTDVDSQVLTGSDGLVFGNFKLSEDDSHVTMYVNGNNMCYQHPNRFPELLHSDVHVLENPDKAPYNITIVVTNSISFSGTIYKRFSLTKSLVKPSEESINASVTTLWIQRPLPEQHKFITKEKIGLTADDYTWGENAIIQSKDKQIMVTSINEVLHATQLCLNKTAKYSKEWYGFNKESYRRWVTNLTMGRVESSFTLETSIFNKIVDQFLKAQILDKKFFSELLMLVNSRLPGADYEYYLIPIICTAMKKALQVEARIVTLLDSELLQEYRAVKADEYSVKKKTPWYAFVKHITSYIFGGDKDINDLSHNAKTGLVDEPVKPEAKPEVAPKKKKKNSKPVKVAVIEAQPEVLPEEQPVVQPPIQNPNQGMVAEPEADNEIRLMPAQPEHISSNQVSLESQQRELINPVPAHRSRGIQCWYSITRIFKRQSGQKHSPLDSSEPGTSISSRTEASSIAVINPFQGGVN